MPLGSQIQSVLFLTEAWTATAARDWLISRSIEHMESPHLGPVWVEFVIRPASSFKAFVGLAASPTVQIIQGILNGAD